MPPRRPVGGRTRSAFGKRINKARAALDLTVAQLAERVGVQKNTVYSWQQGKTIPHGNNLERLADALGEDVDELENMIASDQAANHEEPVAETSDRSVPTQESGISTNQLLLEAGGHFRLDIRQDRPIYVHVTIGPIESFEWPTRQPRRAS